MKLHWSPRSPYVRKVMVVAHELGLADRIDCVRTVAAAAKPVPELMRDNPLSKIPTLVLDDGTAIYDSPVICEYLDRLNGSQRLFPTEQGDRMKALRRQALADGVMDFLIVWRAELTRPPEQRSQALLQAYEVKLKAAVDALERDVRDLETSAWSIGHIAIGCVLSYLDFRFPGQNWRQGRPQLAAWHAKFSERPAVLATTHVDDS
jgi:glutathione S-transferase